MAQYTMELGTAMEAMIGRTEPATFPEIQNVIDKARPLVFVFTYPIFDETYRSVLEDKILLTYYQREICCVPFSKFQLYLWQKLQRIMPYYNQLYYSETIKFNPLWTTDYSRTYKRKNDGTSNQTENQKGTNSTDLTVDRNTDSGNDVTTTSSGKDTNKVSDTPQGTIENLESGKYMTQAQINENDITTTQKDSGSITEKENTNTTANTQNEKTGITTTNNLEDYVESVGGKQGGESYGKLLTEYRDALINIDDMILNELNDCFFMIY